MAIKYSYLYAISPTKSLGKMIDNVWQTCILSSFLPRAAAHLLEKRSQFHWIENEFGRLSIRNLNIRYE